MARALSFGLRGPGFNPSCQQKLFIYKLSLEFHVSVELDTSGDGFGVQTNSVSVFQC
jgi:hypothetical protein